MMYRLVLSLFLCTGVCIAGPQSRDKRQAGCTEPAVTNICSSDLTGPVNLPHPTDPSKFLQCAPGGRMFIIKCPNGEQYSQDTTNCVGAQVTTPPTSTNPCTAENIAANKLFFAYPGDKSRFIECAGENKPNVLSCPSRLEWSSQQSSCIYVAGSGATVMPAVTQPSSGSTGTGTGGNGGNPCAGQVNANNLFFPGPRPSQYFQCDLAGNAYLMNCPATLIWNQAISRCNGAGQPIG